MKFQPDRASDHSIRSYGPGWVMVGNEKIEHSLLLGPDGLRQNWNCQRFEDLRSEHFAPLAELDVELVLFVAARNCALCRPLGWRP